jgi:hypothetical protein
MNTHSVEVSRSGKIVGDKEVMMRAHPKLVRLAVFRESDAGKSTRQVATAIKCSPAWVRRVKQERRELCKYGPYRNRRPNRHGGTLKDHVKAVLIEEASITVEELQRVFGPGLTTKLLVAIREELFINNSVYWYGAEETLPPTDIARYVLRISPSATPSTYEAILKERINELLDWRPQLTHEALEHILGVVLRGELIIEAKEDLALRRAIQRRDESERAAQILASQSRVLQPASSSGDHYPSL